MTIDYSTNDKAYHKLPRKKKKKLPKGQANKNIDIWKNNPKVV